MLINYLDKYFMWTKLSAHKFQCNLADNFQESGSEIVIADIRIFST